MKTISINIQSDLYTEQMKAAHSKGYTLVCSQRPINGLNAFQSNSIGNGVYFNYGLLNDYKEHWLYHDCTIVTTYNNEYVMNQILSECKENEVTLSEVLEYSTIEEIADSLELQYV